MKRGRKISGQLMCVKAFESCLPKLVAKLLDGSNFVVSPLEFSLFSLQLPTNQNLRGPLLPLTL